MKKVLLVDDEKQIVSLLKKRLEEVGCEVHAVEDGEKALASLESLQPDVIVLDIVMPNMDGYTFFQEYQKRYKDSSANFMILSAQDSMLDIFKREGVTEFINKPFQVEDVISRIQQLGAS